MVSYLQRETTLDILIMDDPRDGFFRTSLVII